MKYYSLAVTVLSIHSSLSLEKRSYLLAKNILDEAKVEEYPREAVQEHGPSTWEEEFNEALRKLQEELDAVSRMRTLNVGDAEDDEDKNNFNNGNDLDAENNASYFRLSNKKSTEDCKIIKVTFNDLDQFKDTSLNFPDDCKAKGYVPKLDTLFCDEHGKRKEDIEFPVHCTYMTRLKSEKEKEDSRMLTMEDKTYLDDRVFETETRSLKKMTQLEWIALASKKISIGESEGGCTPSYHGREVRGVECYWKGWDMYCDCKGWEQHTLDCWKPCSHYNDEYTETVGYYCWKPCYREGQVAFNVGCGLTPADRTCARSDEDCVLKYINQALAIVDVLSNILGGDVGNKFSNAVKAAEKATTKAAAEKGIKDAVQAAAKEFAKSITENKEIKKKIEKYRKQSGKALKEEVYEQGSALFLKASLGSQPDFGAIANEITEAVDPTGIYGLVKGMIPPEYCDEMVYMEDIPDE